MRTETLSIRIKKGLKEKMKRLNGIDWRREIENFIEAKVREAEALKMLNVIDETLSGIQASKEPAWQTIREFRDKR